MYGHAEKTLPVVISLFLIYVPRDKPQCLCRHSTLQLAPDTASRLNLLGMAPVVVFVIGSLFQLIYLPLLLFVALYVMLTDTTQAVRIDGRIRVI